MPKPTKTNKPTAFSSKVADTEKGNALPKQKSSSLSKKAVLFGGVAAAAFGTAAYASRNLLERRSNELGSLAQNTLQQNSNMTLREPTAMERMLQGNQTPEDGIPRGAPYTQEFYELPVTSATVGVRVKNGVANVRQSAPIELPVGTGIGLKVVDATVVTVRLSNPNDANEWVQINYVEPTIQGTLSVGGQSSQVGVYLSASFLSKSDIIGFYTHAGFLHNSRQLNTREKGGLAIRIMRVAKGQRAVAYDDFYPQALMDGLQVQYPLRGIANQWTYEGAAFDPRTPDFDFNADYDSNKPVTDPSQTEWSSASTLRESLRDKIDPEVMKRLTSLTLGSDGKMTFTRQVTADIGIGYLPTKQPTRAPSAKEGVTNVPTKTPTTRFPTNAPTAKQVPTKVPSASKYPTRAPTKGPTTAYPTSKRGATPAPTSKAPTRAPKKKGR